MDRTVHSPQNPCHLHTEPQDLSCWDFSFSFLSLSFFKVRDGEIAPWLRGLATLAEDQGLVPCTHTVSCNHLLTPIPEDSTPALSWGWGCAFNPSTREAEAGDLQ